MTQTIWTSPCNRVAKEKSLASCSSGWNNAASGIFVRNRLDFWLLKLNGRIVAAQLGLRYGDTVFSLQEGYDPDYSTDSVGYVLRSQVLRNLIAQGVHNYDFLRGTDESKARWGSVVKSYLNINFARPRSRKRLSLGGVHNRGAESRLA